MSSNVAAATQVHDQRPDAEDGAEGDAPPAQEEGEQGVLDALEESALARADEINAGVALEGDDDQGDGVREDDKFAASLELLV